MSSSRLPGKVLMPFAGTTILGSQLERLASSPATGKIIVATSIDRSDDPIAEWCEREAIAHVRGPLEDVAARFILALEKYPADAFFRYCADRPLYDTKLMDDALALYRTGSYDLVTNTIGGGFPSGLGTELLSSEIFKNAYPRFSEASEREHVTEFFYRRSEELSIGVLRSGGRFAEADRLSLDTNDDLRILYLLMNRLKKPLDEHRWFELVQLKREILVEEKHRNPPTEDR